LIAAQSKVPSNSCTNSPRIAAAASRAREMTDAIMAFDGVWGVNLYASYATMRANLDPGKKGGERDVEYVFAAVADIDNDPGKAAQREIGIEPSYVIESSPGNFQRIYLFDDRSRQPRPNLSCVRSMRRSAAIMRNATVPMFGAFPGR
jgi:hypothetical protein